MALDIFTDLLPVNQEYGAVIFSRVISKKLSDVYLLWTCCAVLSRSVVFSSLRLCGLFSTRLHHPWDSPGKSIGVHCHSLLQGIFPTQGSNPGIPCCRQIFYQLSHQGSSWILEWVAFPFSWGSSRPRYWTGVSCMPGKFFTSWATREAPNYL